VQKPFLAQPSPPFYEFAVHDGDLTGGTPERDEAEFDPEAKASPKETCRSARVVSPAREALPSFVSRARV
jgi:hypothetical protein